MNGKLIILEGPDGVGKTTTASMMLNELRAQGVTARLLAFPGNEEGTLGKLVHDLHHRGASLGIKSIHPTSLQLLHAAAHVDAIYRRIRPALDGGAWVIMDRYWWSTIVYGREYGVDAASLAALEQLARAHWSFVTPAAAFVFLTRPTEAPDAGREFERLRGQYEKLLSGLNEPFPIHRFDQPAAPERRVRDILNALGADRRHTGA